ncbi:uncharacterized protein LOC131168330 isoform X2 [Malania oleifera]|uniref:uncharacterized protein LOC131168330 isoform X2 n=1 Tax=Malania oleifera TaxID=397392 RepID=UPI0025ADD088|nr:uncharacterized protein LOC131168330 isoform X2 [Malania oleifera]
MKKENGSAQANCQEKRKKLPCDNYGSFFGPSTPVIAQRVIQESKSFLETQHLASKVSESQHHNKNGFASTAARPSQPKVTNELKMKVQKLRDTRDYSFLLSDDAELPVLSEESQPRNGTISNSEEHRHKKKHVRQYSDDEDDDEDGRAISMIRKMFRYNPNKFASRDDDDSDLEANFDDILKEERRSDFVVMQCKKWKTRG